jgi:ABC-type multidrug transport system fused ATPase/permease subunit
VSGDDRLLGNGLHDGTAARCRRRTAAPPVPDSRCGDAVAAASWVDSPASPEDARVPEPDPPADDSAAAGVPLRAGLRLLAASAREEPRVFAAAVSGSAVFALCTVLAATVVGRVTDHTILPALASGHTSTAALGGAVAAIVGLAVVKVAGILGRRVGAGVMQTRLQARYRRRVTRAFQRLPMGWHQTHPTGELLAFANSDVEAMFWPIAPFPFACGVLVILVATAVQLLLVDVQLALVGFAIFPVVFLLNYVYNHVQSPAATRAQAMRGEVSAIAHESFDGALVVKTLGREASETQRFADAAGRLRDANIRLGRWRGLFDPLMEALPTVGVLVVLWLGAERVQAGDISTGALVKVAYLFVVIAFPIRAIGWVLADLPRAVVGRERVGRVLAATGEMTYGEQVLPTANGPLGVSARDVRFAYVEGQPVLEGVTFAVKAGTTVAVVGTTGSGKSTLATLLVRLVDPDDGVVRFGRIDVRSLARGQVSGAVAFVPQTTFVFDDTVRGNVTLGLDVTDERVWAALRLAQADGFVSALPRGLDTRVGERGTSLSGGQRQRLALARALVRRPRLLVLDDATSSVDPQVEAAILSGLRDANASGELPSTVVVVAYRRATIMLADEVVFLQDGRIAARGPHDELLAHVDGYRELVTAYDRDPDERHGSGRTRAQDLQAAR